MRLLHFVILVLLGWGSGCGTHGVPMTGSSKAVVSGIAQYSPGYDGEIMYPPLRPEDTAARPLVDAYIVLIKAPRVNLLTQKVLACDTTDSTGAYSIEASPGQYLLLVSAPQLRAPVISELAEDSTHEPTPYNALYEVLLEPGRVTRQDIHIAEISYQ